MSDTPSHALSANVQTKSTGSHSSQASSQPAIDRPASRSASTSASHSRRRPWSAGNSDTTSPFGVLKGTFAPPLSPSPREYQPSTLISGSSLTGEQRKPLTRMRSDSHSAAFAPAPPQQFLPSKAITSANASPPKMRARITGRGGAGSVTSVSAYGGAQTTNSGVANLPIAGDHLRSPSFEPPGRDPTASQAAQKPLTPASSTSASSSQQDGRSDQLKSSILHFSSRSRSGARRETDGQDSSSIHERRTFTTVQSSSDADVTWFEDSTSSARSPGWAEASPPSEDEILNQPLPVRLGLVPPFTPSELQQMYSASPIHHFRGQAGSSGARFVDGYYLYNAPPKVKRPGPTPRGHSRHSTTKSFGATGSTSSSETLTTHRSERTLVEGEHHRPCLHKKSSFRMPDGYPNGRPQVTDSGHTEESSTSSSRWQLDDYFTYTEYRNTSGAKRVSKHHGYSNDLIPYVVSYDEAAVESELILHNVTWEALSRRHSVIPYGDKPPARVLDLGTGTGVWCVDAARDWQDSEFIGLDVVPCQTPLSYRKDKEIQSRVSWVVADFLKELPFPSSSFDLVHLRYVSALAIQEDEWDTVLNEITRVVKPDGRVELLEHNLTFVGNVTNIPMSKMMRLAGGKSSAVTEQVPQPARQYGAIEDAMERLLTRRFINSNPLSVIPTALIISDLRDIQSGNPRKMPFLVDESQTDLIFETDPAKVDWSKHFTARSQIGKPLSNSGFAPHNFPLMLNLLAIHRAELFFAMRDLIWEEVEEEKKTLLSRSAGHLGQGRMPGVIDTTVACWAHPWKNRAAFQTDIESLRSLLWARADYASPLRKILGWREGDLESVEERKMAARREKMTQGINNVALPPGFTGGENGEGSSELTPAPRQFTHDDGGDISPTSSGISMVADLTSDSGSVPPFLHRGSDPPPIAASRRGSLAFAMSPVPGNRGAPASSPSRPSSSSSTAGSPLNRETRPPPQLPPASSSIDTSTQPSEKLQEVGTAPLLHRASNASTDGASAQERDGEARTSLDPSSQRRASSLGSSIDGMSSSARKTSIATPSYIAVLGFFESTGFTAMGKVSDEDTNGNGNTHSHAGSTPSTASLSAQSFPSTSGAGGGGGGRFEASGMTTFTPSQRASRLSRPRSSSPKTRTHIDTADTPPSPNVPAVGPITGTGGGTGTGTGTGTGSDTTSTLPKGEGDESSL